MSRNLAAIDDVRVLVRVIRDLQKRVRQLEARVEIENLQIITNPADEISEVVSTVDAMTDIPLASSVKNRLLLVDRTGHSTSKDPLLVLSRRQKTGSYAWLQVAGTN